MIKKSDNKEQYLRMARNEKTNVAQGYPIYAPGEDFYTEGQKVRSINTENISKDPGSDNKDLFETDIEINPENNLSDTELDVPGSELDDKQEVIGSEDEENNYYSLSGDDQK
jgi:hypothetical protein